MFQKLLFTSLAAALALGAAGTQAGATPAGNFGGARAADGTKLLHAVHDGYDRGGRSWSRRFHWNDDDHHGRRKWRWHRRHHRDRDHDRWSWGRDRDGWRGHHNR